MAADSMVTPLVAHLPAVSSPPPRTVFVSYASADRAAARRLRDTLLQSGLKVWLDEDEIAGGDAWDAKIRHQIQTCDFFMPVVSASTDARSEGYFRREWRWAAERMMDLADDVLFLIPVAIDGTAERGARVPDPFNSVQWIRCVNGVCNTALLQLASRLAEGSREKAMRPAIPATSALERAWHPRVAPAELPPLPPFPAFPARDQHAVFVYDVVVWVGRTTVSLWSRMPLWLQVGCSALIVLKLIGSVFGPH